MTTWTMPLSYDKPPLSLNDRGHWSKFEPHRYGLRAEAHKRARSMKIPRDLEHITTRLHYVAPDGRRRDEDNLLATAKPLWDGLVDAGIVADDTSEYMTKLMPRIHPKGTPAPAALWLIISDERGADL
ncbi:hypothetical protein [Corynebacterium sp. AOP12-C2-36]|uniref:hypothetical protein n=1 Tax=Corynebacterium sp. AOP12-C2-36 TaxID=3457723 RepID=UPI0040347902